MPHSQPSKGGSEGAPPRRRQHRGRTSNTAPSGSRARFDLGSSRAEAGPGEEGWDDVALSHAATKNNPSFKGFFEQLDDLTLKAMDDRDWACPACHGGGPRFKGLQPLLSHAKDVASHRVPLHRALGLVLEAELKRRLAACLLTRGALATWMGPTRSSSRRVASDGDRSEYALGSRRPSQDRAKVKYDMVSYESMVVEPMKKMKDNSEKLAWLETKVVEDQERTKALEEVANRMAQKFDMQESEAKLMIRKYTEKVNELKIELDYMEHAYKQEIEQLSQDLAVKDQEMENIQKELEAKHI